MRHIRHDESWSDPHMPPLAAGWPDQVAKRAIVSRVRAIFNDQARGETPVVRSDDGLFAPGSMIWRVHGDVITMMAGGMAALLLQMLHPAVLAGVWDHSDFRRDMLGRLRRTARFVAVTTYGSRAEAGAAIARVRSIHDHVSGTLPGGGGYDANDPGLLAWVHVTEATSFLNGWIRYAHPDTALPERDDYFAQMAVIARRMGADPVPETSHDADLLIESVRPELICDSRTREVARLVLEQRPENLTLAPVQAMVAQAAVDILPAWARQMHGLPAKPLLRPLVRAGPSGIASTLRWAFR